MQVTPHPPYGHPLPYLFSVAQIVNLPYRRLQIGRALAVFRRPGQGAVLQDGILRYSRLAVCATNTTEALNRNRAAALRATGALLIPCLFESPALFSRTSMNPFLPPPVETGIIIQRPF